MKLNFIIFLCLGVVALVESAERCIEIISKSSFIRLEKLNFMPDTELLTDICPELIKYVECVEDKELPDADDDVQEFFYGLKGILLDVCEENSELQQVYLSSVSCVRTEVLRYPSCDEIGLAIYIDFREFENITKSGVLEYDREHQCMIDSIAVACTAINILEECGDEAHQAFVEVVRRSHIMKRLCTPEGMLRLRSDFFDFLTSRQNPHVDLIRTLIERKK